MKYNTIHSSMLFCLLFSLLFSQTYAATAKPVIQKSNTKLILTIVAIVIFLVTIVSVLFYLNSKSDKTNSAKQIPSSIIATTSDKHEDAKSDVSTTPSAQVDQAQDSAELARKQAEEYERQQKERESLSQQDIEESLRQREIERSIEIKRQQEITRSQLAAEAHIRTETIKQSMLESQQARENLQQVEDKRRAQAEKEQRQREQAEVARKKAEKRQHAHAERMRLLTNKSEEMESAILSAELQESELQATNSQNIAQLTQKLDQYITSLNNIYADSTLCLTNLTRDILSLLPYDAPDYVAFEPTIKRELAKINAISAELSLARNSQPVDLTAIKFKLNARVQQVNILKTASKSQIQLCIKNMQKMQISNTLQKCKTLYIELLKRLNCICNFKLFAVVEKQISDIQLNM